MAIKPVYGCFLPVHFCYGFRSANLRPSPSNRQCTALEARELSLTLSEPLIATLIYSEGFLSTGFGVYWTSHTYLVHCRCITYHLAALVSMSITPVPYITMPEKKPVSQALPVVLLPTVSSPASASSTTTTAASSSLPLVSEEGLVKLITIAMLSPNSPLGLVWKHAFQEGLK